MASRIKETPILTGKDAERFRQAMKENEGKKETPEKIAEMKANYEKIMKISKF